MLNGFASSFTQRPAKSTDGPAEIAPRGNGYGESFSQPASADGLDVSLNEGSYYSGVLSGYVPGTGALAAAQATFSDTSAFMMIKSAAANAGAPVGVRLDTLKLIVSNVGAGITAARIVAVLDSATRWRCSRRHVAGVRRQRQYRFAARFDHPGAGRRTGSRRRHRRQAHRRTMRAESRRAGAGR